MNRKPFMLVSLAIAAAFGGAIQGGGSYPGQAGMKTLGPELRAAADRPGTPQRTVSVAKAHRLDFFRGKAGKRRHTYKGIGMTVAQGKRMARKRAGVRKHRQRIHMKA